MRLSFSNNAGRVIFVLIVILAGYAGSQANAIRQLVARQRAPTWSVITLDNGLIYYGQVKDKTAQFVIITEAYYTQDSSKAQAGSGDTTKPTYVLARVGQNEIYGPENTMQLNRDHIVLIQKLKDDSPVLKTIREGQKP